MKDETKEEILARLRKVGDNGLALTEDKWAQLEAIDRAARVMVERRRKAIETIKSNELTVANMERILKELGGKTVTDQTMRNNGRLLEKFMLTYCDMDVSYYEANEEIKRHKDSLKKMKQKLEKMEIRDAECEDAIQEMERLKLEYDRLKRDNEVMLADLIRYKKKDKKGGGIVMTEIDLTKPTGESS